MPVSSSAWFRPGQAFTAEQYLDVLDAHGVHFGVIAGISIFGTYNDYMIAQLRKYKRLRGTAIVDSTTDRYALERMKADGIVGIRLQLTRQDLPDLAGDEYRMLFRRLADLDLHIEVVVEGPRWPQVLPHLEASGAKIVIDHFGHPDPQAGINCTGFQAVLRSVEQGRTWVKLSAPFRLTWAAPGLAQRDPAVRRARARGGALPVGERRARSGWSGAVTVHSSGTSRARLSASTLKNSATWVPDARMRRELSDTALKLYFS